ncbi:hypothetical protein [Candidatus Enterococcus willemsii]|uniref:Uncharacterized protein n=1 Tax=Candidatus Enterococcus willemsii TaxID=1857215 RepID=A0ABQ6YY99_9ENTE|nr:hypothetical protein [Enterococcus sp. CU12B]KAF1302468.1 hypothetical protein BAU17_13955 [Enterococcus sp. CU12B]
MESYIFTFGLGHIYEQKAIKIIASDWQSARNCMVEHFDYDFSTQYFENDYLDFCRNMKLTPYPIIKEFIAK